MFVLISGFFLINDTSSKLSATKVLKLWGHVFFYSSVIFLIYVGFTGSISIKELIKAFMPITQRTWWFASAYFVLFLIHLYLNAFLRSLNKREYQHYLLLLLFLWCIIPTFLLSSFESNDLIWFITLYSVAGYFRLYGMNEKVNQHAGKLAIIIMLITYASCVLFTLLGTKWPFFENHRTFFYGANKLPTFLTSVCLLIAFSNLKIGCTKWLNRISSATFGVYLMHEHFILRPILWKNIFHNASYQDSLLLIPYSIAVMIIVYGICTLIDLLRQRFIEQIFMKSVDRNIEKVSELFDRVRALYNNLRK